MRSIFVATLALSPALLHAQATSPAPKPVLQAGLTSPAVPGSASATASSADHATPNTVRVSTGIVAPRLIHSVEIGSSSDWPMRVIGGDKTVILSMLLDDTGKPTNLHVITSAGNFLDSEVVRAVTQYRYQPALLDGEPTAIPVNLKVTLQPGAKY